MSENLKAETSNNLECAREKYWHEKNSEERIQTLASDLAAALVTIEVLRNKLELFDVHAHDSAGNIHVPLRSKEEYRQFDVSSLRERVWMRLGLIPQR